jgi:hypothetical protein
LSERSPASRSCSLCEDGWKKTVSQKAQQTQVPKCYEKKLLCQVQLSVKPERPSYSIIIIVIDTSHFFGKEMKTGCALSASQATYTTRLKQNVTTKTTHKYRTKHLPHNPSVSGIQIMLQLEQAGESTLEPASSTTSSWSLLIHPHA